MNTNVTSTINTDKQIDILLQTIDRYWNQAIQLENQRANFTNYIILIVGAIQGYIIQREFDKLTIFLSSIIIVISIFGSIITIKYYERFRQQTSKVGRLMEKLSEIEPSINLDELEYKADQKHKKKYPITSKIPLNKLWLCFYLLFFIMGVIDMLFYIFSLYSKVKVN